MRTITKVIIKVLALFFALNVLKNAYLYIANWSWDLARQKSDIAPAEMGINFVYYVVGLLILVAIGILIIFYGWWRTDSIIRLMIGNVCDDKLVINTDDTDLYKVLIKFLGIVLLVISIPFLLGHLGGLLIITTMSPENLMYLSSNIQHEIADSITQFVTLLIGIWLFFGGKAIARGIVKLKYAGLEPDEKKEDEHEVRP
jgi:hypothetical protein